MRDIQKHAPKRISRRQFARASQGFLLAGGIARLLPAAEHTDPYSRERFVPLVNSSFEATAPGASRSWLTLLSVEELSKPPLLTTFLLRFQGTEDSLPQGTYQLSHPRAGSFPLFIVPSGKSLYIATICLK